MTTPQIAPTCPYCSADLKKPPKRKARCKSCGEDIYVRTTQELFSTSYLTETQAKASDWLKTLENWGVGLPTYRQMEAELGGDPPPLEVIRAMLRHLMERDDRQNLLWQYARFKADVGEDARETLREAHRESAREYLRSPFVKTLKVAGSNCCEECFPLHDQEFTPTAAVADPPLPPRGCLRHEKGDLCRCRLYPQHDFSEGNREIQIRVPVVRQQAPEAKQGCLLMLLLVPAVLGVVGLTACAGLTPPPEGYLAASDDLTRVVSAEPPAVARAAVRVFARYGLPIQMQDPTEGIVQSDELTVSAMWGDRAVKDALYCGKRWDSGVEYALADPVTFRVGVLAEPVQGGSTVRLNVSGRAEPAGFGAAQQEVQPCQPTAAFAAELLDAIETAATP